MTAAAARPNATPGTCRARADRLPGAFELAPVTAPADQDCEGNIVTTVMTRTIPVLRFPPQADGLRPEALT